jgi:hypothetical protein
MEVEKNVCQTSRPVLVSTVSPDLAQPVHGLEEEDTLGVILFQRLKSQDHPSPSEVRSPQR